MKHPHLEDVILARQRAEHDEMIRSEERERILKLWNDWCDWCETISKDELVASVESAEWTANTSREYFINLINKDV